MVKFINRKIEVKRDAKNSPAAFRFDGKWMLVTRVLEVWKDTGCWWDGEAEKLFYRAEAAPARPDETGPGESGLYEFFFDTGNGDWFLYKTYD